MADSIAPRLHIQALSTDRAGATRCWTGRLGLPLVVNDEAEFAVQADEQSLQAL